MPSTSNPFVPFYIPLTSEQVEGLTAGAFRELPESEEPYCGFLEYEEATEHAKSIANFQSRGFLLHENIYTKDAIRSVFSFSSLFDVLPYEIDKCDNLEIFMVEESSIEEIPSTETFLRFDSNHSHFLSEIDADILEAQDFFRLEHIYPVENSWYSHRATFAWERLFGAIARRCHLDDEDTSEQGFPHVWRCAQPFLQRVENSPIFCYAARSKEGYVVCIDDTEYLAFRWSEISNQNKEWRYWSSATERLVQVIDRALQKRNISERCFLSGWGNDSEMLFLTDTQRKILVEGGYLKASS